MSQLLNLPGLASQISGDDRVPVVDMSSGLAGSVTISELVSADPAVYALRAGSWLPDPRINRRILNAFNSLSQWTVTQAANTTIVQESDADAFGAASFRFQSAVIASQNAAATQNRILNLSAADGFWLLMRVNYKQTATASSMTIYTSDAVDLAAGTGRFTAIATVPSYAVSLQPHWIPKSKFTTLDGSPSWNNDQLSWRFRLDSSAVEPHDWNLCGTFGPGAERPTVIITLDDGNVEAYTIGHVNAQVYQIPLTFYLIPNLIDQANYMTSAQVAAVVAAGDYCGVHGDTRWDTNLSLIAQDVAGLKALGIDTEHAAYPEGRIGDGTTWIAMESALTAAGVKTARLAGLETPTLRTVGDPLALASYPLNNTKSLAAAKSIVDTAISAGGTVIFYGHKFGAVADATTWTTSDWKELLAYISQKRLLGLLDTLTIKQWWDM